MVIPGSYSQRDGRWANELVGFNTDPGFNLYHYGCTVTAIANYLWYIGHPECNPSWVNQALKGKGGFVQGGLLVWGVVPAIHPDIKYSGTTASLDQVRKFVEADGNFAILHVTKPGFPMHYVVEVDPGRIVDSWDGMAKPDTSYQFIDAHLYGDNTLNEEKPMATDSLTLEEGKVIYGLAAPGQGINEDFVNKHVGGKLDDFLNDLKNDPSIQSFQQGLVDKSKAYADAQAKIAELEHPAVNTTEAVQPIPVVQKEVIHPEVKVDEGHHDGPVAVVQDTSEELQVVSVFQSQPHIKLDSGALITDLNSGIDIQRVPQDTPIKINRIVRFKGTQYAQTDKLVTLNHGISEQYLQFVTPLSGADIPTTEDVGKLWHKTLKFMHIIREDK